MWLVRAALRSRYTIAVMAIVILVMASLSARRMSADVLPNIDIPVVVVVWSYAGLSAEDMERRIVLVSERAYSSSVGGISRIESRSISGVGMLKIYFEPHANVGSAIAQISSMSQTITRLMPVGTFPPTVLQYNASNVPVAQLTVSSETQSEQQLFDYGLNFLRVRLFTIPGLSTPLPYGGKARQIMVDVDPSRLASHGLGSEDVVRALLDANLTLPAGTARIGDTEYDVDINNSPATVEEFSRIPLRYGHGAPVRLGDVARVQDGFAVQQNIVRVDGKRATYLALLKKSDASTLAVVDSTKELLPQIRSVAPPGVELKLDFDQSVFVRLAASAVLEEALAAAALVTLLMLLGLGSWRSAVLVASSIPLAIGAAIAGLYLSGQTINLMTMGGLALAIGLLVDDATVEVENIHRNRKLGKPLVDAILQGAQEVARPALAATLSVCLVFIPVWLMEGPARFLFAPLAMAVVFAMLATYLLSRTLVPALASVLLVKEETAVDARSLRARANGKGASAFEALRNRYVGALRGLLQRRYLGIAAFVAALGLAGGVARAVGVDFFPEVDAGQMRLHVRAPVGTRIERTEEIVSSVESTIRNIIPPRDLQTINDDIGVPTPLNLAFVQTDNIGSQDADVLISLRPGHGPTAAYRTRIREELGRAFPDTRFYFQPADIVTEALGFGTSAPVEVSVVGTDLEESSDIALRLRDRLRAIPGIVDARVAQVFDRPALRIDVDRERAARLGLSQRDVADNVLTSLSSSGLVWPSFWLNPQNSVNYLVAVQTPLQKLDSTKDLMSTPLTGSREGAGEDILSPKSKPIPYLGGIASMRTWQSKALISHETIQRVIQVQANVEGRDLGSVSKDIDRAVAEEHDLPKGTRILVRGQGPSMLSAFRDLGLGLCLAMLLVYLLLVTLFQSWKDALLIMAAVPGSLAGVIVALAITGTTFNVESFMGTIMSVGVAVSNSILLVHFARALQREQGLSTLDAVVEAGRTRLRPVLMTVLAMVGGMIPIAMGHGEGAEQNAPLGRAVIGGLTVATFVTLFVIPLLYVVAHRRSHAPVSSAFRPYPFLVPPEGAVTRS
jgi:CzcA family heavy metal efflux pump